MDATANLRQNTSVRHLFYFHTDLNTPGYASTKRISGLGQILWNHHAVPKSPISPIASSSPSPGHGARLLPWMRSSLGATKCFLKFVFCPLNRLSSTPSSPCMPKRLKDKHVFSKNYLHIQINQWLQKMWKEGMCCVWTSTFGICTPGHLGFPIIYAFLSVCLSIYKHTHMHVYAYVTHILTYISTQKHTLHLTSTASPFLIQSLYFVCLLALYSKGKSKRYVIKTLLSF